MSVPDNPPVVKRYRGGPDYHKPGCGCPVCTRRREKEALSLGDGTASPQEKVLKVPSKNIETSAEKVEKVSPDLPPIVLKGRDARSRISQWLEFKTLDPSATTAEIAERMGLRPNTLYALISRATKEGWLQFDDPLSRIEYEIIPKTIDNLSYFLDAKDRTVTIEAAKGTIFKQYQESKGISDSPNYALAIKIEHPPSSNDSEGSKPSISISSASIVGTPRFISPSPEDDN